MDLLTERQRPHRRRGIGVFSELPVPPQEPTRAIARSFKDSLAGGPGIRLAQQRGRRVFFGGGAPAVHRFMRAPSSVNSKETVRASLLHMNARRALGRARGLGAVERP